MLKAEEEYVLAARWREHGDPRELRMLSLSRASQIGPAEPID
jgi:hypothetical protein